MKRTLICIIIIGVVLLVCGKIMMRFDNDDTNISWTNNTNANIDSISVDNGDVEEELINKEYDELKNIDIEVGYYSITIEEDSNINKIQLSLRKPKINSGKDINKVECKNGNLTITQRQEKSWSFSGNFNLNNYKGEILIKIPTKNELNKIKIDSGVGSIKLINITAESLTIDTGTSTVDLKSVDVNNCNISGGTGSINLNDVSIDKLDIDTGTGSVYVNGDIRKSADIDTGTASVKLELEGKEKDYSYDIETGLGNIVINQNKYKKEANISNASSSCKLKIETGTGSVTIKTK